jgi:hypothetical protein
MSWQGWFGVAGRPVMGDHLSPLAPIATRTVRRRDDRPVHVSEKGVAVSDQPNELAPPAEPKQPTTTDARATAPPPSQLFRFDGGAATFVGTALLAFFITILTLGICYPFAVVLMERWRSKHTILQGRRLRFTGSATGLFFRWLWWFFLTIVTIGIYSFWVVPRMTQWRVEHLEWE